MRILILVLAAALAGLIGRQAAAITIDPTQTAVLIPGGLFPQPMILQPDAFEAIGLDNSVGGTTATDFEWTLLNGSDLAHATLVAQGTTHGLAVAFQSVPAIPNIGVPVASSVFSTFFQTGVWAPILLLDVPSGTANIDFLDYGVISFERSAAGDCGDGGCSVSGSNAVFTAIPRAVPEPRSMMLLVGPLLIGLGLRRSRRWSRRDGPIQGRAAETSRAREDDMRRIRLRCLAILIVNLALVGAGGALAPAAAVLVEGSFLGSVPSGFGSPLSPANLSGTLSYDTAAATVLLQTPTNGRYAFDAPGSASLAASYTDPATAAVLGSFQVVAPTVVVTVQGGLDAQGRPNDTVFTVDATTPGLRLTLRIDNAIGTTMVALPDGSLPTQSFDIGADAEFSGSLESNGSIPPALVTHLTLTTVAEPRASIAIVLGGMLAAALLRRRRSGARAQPSIVGGVMAAQSPYRVASRAAIEDAPGSLSHARLS